MKITALTTQQRDPNRLNVLIDGVYRFSLTLTQVVDLGIAVGMELSEETVEKLEGESTYGKLYQRTLEYCFVRQRSEKEVRDYLYRKTRPTPVKNRTTGQVSIRPGVSQSVAQRVLDTLTEKGYLDDRKFAEFWVQHRFMRKGISQRKLRVELMAKGVDAHIIKEVLQASERDDSSELQKVVAKKRARYTDDVKFMQYLARQGFSYDDIKEELARGESD